MSDPGGRRKILFFAEAVTLAHVARPLALAAGLDPARFEIMLATAPRYESLWSDVPFAVRSIESISSEAFLGAIANGRTIYSAATLRRYVEDDLAVIREFDPDVIIGDLRISLSVSARLARVPYLAIINAYWSPFARQKYPLPDLPMVRHLGLPAARLIFNAARPLAFALQTRPLNRVRRGFGLPSLGNDLRRVYTDADQTLYADVPELVPTFGLPSNHHYLGPVLWSPSVARPDWWDELDDDRPIVYVTLGSSGRADLLPIVLDALSELPVTVIATTLGRPLARPVPRNVLLADYLPGDDVANRSRLVVCNGGSPTTYQALAAGVPVLGIASNMDQHLNMAGIVRAGAGEVIRSDRATLSTLRASAGRILNGPGYAASAEALAGVFAGYDCHARLLAILASC